MKTKQQLLLEKLNTFQHTSSDFLTTIGKSKYLIVVDEHEQLYNKVRHSLLKYKSLISVMHAKNYNDAKIFINKNKKKIKGILIEFSPTKIVNITTESIKQEIPIVVIPECNSEYDLSGLSFNKLAYTLGM